MNRHIGFVALFLACNLVIRAQEESGSPAAAEKSYPEAPKEYELGQDAISPDGRFAILYPVRDEDSNVAPDLPNVLVRLKPYAVLKEIESEEGGLWKGARGEPRVEVEWQFGGCDLARSQVGR